MFGGCDGVQMTTNLAIYVYVGKSEKLQKHPLKIVVPKVMLGTCQIDAESFVFS